MLRIEVDRLAAIYRDVARAHGADADEQGLFAHGLLLADFRGHPTQGVGLLAYLDELFETGIMHFGQPVEVVRDSPALAVLDGHGGSGHVVAARAMDRAIAMARSAGAGFVTVRNSGDCGMLATYALQAVAAGMAGLAMSTGPLLVAPWGGRDAMFCTNPLALAVPAGEREPIVVDMATSADSMGQVVLAARDGRKLPAATVVDGSGVYTDDPSRVILDPLDRESRMSGALLPPGPKGFGMVLMVELLAGLLSGERTWTAETGAPGGDGDRGDRRRQRAAHYAQSFLALPVDRCQPPEAFLAASDRMIAALTGLPPAQGFERVRLPGQGARERERDYRANGVPVRPEEWEQVQRVLARLNVR